jgi:dipeptidyl aminopeptidase/acylaminoacyl peptidase
VSASYRVPPQEIVDLVDAPPTPDVQFSPDLSWLAILEQPSLPRISEIAEPELGLAGIRIRPRTNGPIRTSFLRSVRIQRLEGDSEVLLTGIPDPARIGDVRWSPDSTHLAFTVTEAAGISLWVARVASGRAARLTLPILNIAYGNPYSWTLDSKEIVCRVVTEGRLEAPKAFDFPSGPVIQETAGRKAPVRTYQNLLQSPHDERLFEHYFTGQIARVTLGGDVKRIGSPGLIIKARPSPDGKHLLVSAVHRPFSYRVPITRFPLSVEVLDLEGKLERRIADLPLAEEIPVAFDAVRTGPRDFDWRDDAPATLVWVEARDEGNPAVPAEVRDEVLAWAFPFDGPPRSLIQLGFRLSTVLWGSDRLALVSERWWKTRRTRTFVIAPRDSAVPPRLLFDRSSEDRYGDPGTPNLKPTPSGGLVLRTTPDESSIFLVGKGASPDGDLPFLDKFEVATCRSRRLFRSEAPYYEYPLDLLDDEGLRLVTRRESNCKPPNYLLRDLGSGKSVALTRFPHPTPQLASVRRELIRYERGDGVKLSASLSLPPGYDPGRDGPLPTVFWAYPAEFKSVDAAGQVTDSPHRFVGFEWSSALYLLTRGYAVVDYPSLPIVGAGDDEPNDTYVEQLVAGAEAVVEEVLRRGVADRARLAIGGHSYGAFTAANLLAHSDLFRAGIARSGAYNRTLTPFSFQAEERTLWDAPETYMRVSPLIHADLIDEPILLIHGQVDDNEGTFPIQSERLYAALMGLGGTARLVLLPLESHSYGTRESVLHVLWEQLQWLDRHVKGAEPVEEAPSGPAGPLNARHGPATGSSGDGFGERLQPALRSETPVKGWHRWHSGVSTAPRRSSTSSIRSKTVKPFY